VGVTVRRAAHIVNLGHVLYCPFRHHDLCLFPDSWFVVQVLKGRRCQAPQALALLWLLRA
jgi:hypothetical protein